MKTTLPVIVSAASNDGEGSSLCSAILVPWLAATISPVARPRAVISALTHGNDDPRVALYVTVRALPAANSFGSLGLRLDTAESAGLDVYRSRSTSGPYLASIRTAARRPRRCIVDLAHESHESRESG